MGILAAYLTQPSRNDSKKRMKDLLRNVKNIGTVGTRAKKNKVMKKMNKERKFLPSLISFCSLPFLLILGL